MQTKTPLLVFLVLLFLGAAPVQAKAIALADYLPEGVAYDASVPVPSQVLGFEVGERHARHDQIVAYFHAVAEASDRVRLRETGHTYENRPLLLMTVSSPGNLARIEEIRTQHRSLLEGAPPEPDMPAVVWLCYSVHGNEASGSNAALLAAYHLAAARGPEIEALLRDCVILIDPALNPDGLDRFSGWVNRNRGHVPVADPATREHHEPWPGGRTNHYWFDLNRDWLLLTHPESRARVGVYHQWMPNILGDFHEMGTNATYFFQPGVPSRRNPLTPERNAELTAEIARYHARAFDREKRLYFTEERFDDFYYGKGSTYPDINGGVGILFEEASARGHVQRSPNGRVTFPAAVRNQFLTTLSTLEAARDKRAELLDYMSGFYRDAAREAAAGPVRAYVFGDPADRARTDAMVDILLRHDIHVRRLAGRLEREGARFTGDDSYLVPTAQPQARLLRALFERRTSFPDSIFYDVSTWTLPLAMGLPTAEITDGGTVRRLAGEPVEHAPTLGASPPGDSDSTYAYVFGWSETYAPRTLGRLLRAGVRARVALKPFRAATPDGLRDFDRGTVVVPLGIQEVGRKRLHALLARAASKDGVAVHAVTSGLTPGGVDLGSSSLRPLKAPRPLLVVGRGVSATQAGEIWHLLDRRFEMPVTLVEKSRLGNIDLDDYTHLLVVGGSYGDLSPDLSAAIGRWVRAGGVLVASTSALRWVRDADLAPVTLRGEDAKGNGDDGTPSETEAAEAPPRLDYAAHDRNRGAKLTSGAIFEADLDITHPLGFGLGHRRLAVFRRSNLALEPSSNLYGTVARLTDTPLLSGYVTPKNLKQAAGSAALTARKIGRGAVLLFADDPDFRGFWYGTSKLYLNALFFGGVLQRTGE